MHALKAEVQGKCKWLIGSCNRSLLQCTCYGPFSFDSSEKGEPRCENRATLIFNRSLVLLLPLALVTVVTPHDNAPSSTCCSFSRLASRSLHLTEARFFWFENNFEITADYCFEKIFLRMEFIYFCYTSSEYTSITFHINLIKLKDPFFFYSYVYIFRFILLFFVIFIR